MVIQDPKGKKLWYPAANIYRSKQGQFLKRVSEKVWKCEYIPHIYGRYTLNIRCENQHITGSPLTVNIKPSMYFLSIIIIIITNYQSNVILFKIKSVFFYF